VSAIETLPAREKRAAALTSVLAITFLILIKAVAGVLTGSLGLMAEAAHSLMDLAAAGVTYFAIQISARPADSGHTYGHGKFENLSALIESVLLLLACAGIFYEAIQRLLLKSAVVAASSWTLLVMAVAIVVNLALAGQLRRVARKYDSQALEAEALDFRNDVWSSAVVILGLVLVMAASAFHLPWLAKADSIAGMVVAAIVALSVVRLGRRAAGELLDEVPEGLQQEITRAVLLPGVEEVRQVRVRRSGAQSFVDLTLAISRSLSPERAHQIADQAEEAVQGRLPRANVLVHVEPVQTLDEQLDESLRALGSRFGLGVHNIQISQVNGQRILTVHLDIQEGLALEQAHDQASAFEQAIQETLPGFDRVWTHLEPIQRQADETTETTFIADEKIERLIRMLPQLLGAPCDIHEISLLMENNRLKLSFHCSLHGQTPLQDAHALSERMEALLRERIPDLESVLIHMEPLEG
jgi:cation diffusion facilitator family transporter